MTGAETQLAMARTRGYDSFNIKVGYPQTPEYDLQLVRMVCNFAPEGFHWADANANYDVETALAMAPKLADAGLKGLESPLPPNLIRGYQGLKRQGALPILMVKVLFRRSKSRNSSRWKCLMESPGRWRGAEDFGAHRGS